jgi:hypothetical protein
MEQIHPFSVNSLLTSSNFWDITSCIPLKINRRFGRTWLVSCFAYTSTLKVEVMCSSETLIFTTLHSVIYPIRQFIVHTALETADCHSIGSHCDMWMYFNKNKGNIIRDVSLCMLPSISPTLVAAAAVIRCWHSSALSFSVSGPVGTHDHVFVRSKTAYVFWNVTSISMRRRPTSTPVVISWSSSVQSL